MVKHLEYEGRKIKKFILTLLCLSIIVAFLPLTGCQASIDTAGADAANHESFQTELTEKSDKFTESSKTETELNIKIASLKGPTSIGMLKLHKENPSLGNNVNSSYEIAANPETMVAKILSNEVQIAALPTNVAAKLYNKGSGYKIAAITGYGVLYLVEQESDIKNWSDLNGKKINVISKGSTPDIALRYLLEKNNLNPVSDVTLDYTLEQVELSQLMIAGKAQIAILPEPFVTMIINKNPEVKIAFNIEQEWKAAGSGDPMPMSCVVVNADFAEEHREIIDEFLVQYESSTMWANTNIDDAALLVEEFKIGMDAATAKEAIPRCNIQFSGLDKSEAEIKSYINIILGFSPEDVGGKMPDENFYY